MDGYPIGATARLTGLTADSIRAWEKRYGALSPGRSGGRRLYTDADIARLKLLKNAVDSGHRIGRIATLSDEQLNSLPLKKRGVDMGHNVFAGLERVLTLVDNFDAFEAERTLAGMALMLPPRDFVMNVAVPLMQEVGKAWDRKRFNVAQEHMVTNIMRSLLGTLSRFYIGHNRDQNFVFATPSGERHEMGIMIASMLAASRGLNVVYLGADLPEEDTIRATRKTNAAALIIGVNASKQNEKALLESLLRIATGIPRQCKLIVGGHFTKPFLSKVPEMGGILIDSFPSFEHFLEGFIAA